MIHVCHDTLRLPTIIIHKDVTTFGRAQVKGRDMKKKQGRVERRSHESCRALHKGDNSAAKF